MRICTHLLIKLKTTQHKQDERDIKSGIVQAYIFISKRNRFNPDMIEIFNQSKLTVRF